MDYKLLKTVGSRSEAASLIQMLHSHGIATQFMETKKDECRIYVYEGDFARAQFLVEEL